MRSKDLARKLKQGKAPTVIDVRSGIEYRAGHIPDALHLPSSRVLFSRSRLPADKSTLLVVTCEHGPRAQLASGLLRLLGFQRVELLEGHMAGWRKAQLPLES